MMSNQSQRMRKNVSPGAATKQGPIRATVPLSLMHQTCSPTKCLKGSPKSSPVGWTGDGIRVKTRLSPDNRISPETYTTSTGCRAEKSKSGAKTSPGPYIRRTASVDTIYLLGQWQRDALYLSYCGRLMMDRATQTPDEFEDNDKKLLQKRCGSSCGETLEMKFIRQRLQRTSHSPRLMGSPNQRQSPLPGDHHQVISTSCGGGMSSPTLPSTSPHPQGSSSSQQVSAAGNNNATLSSFASSFSRALPIPIPDIPKPLIPRMRSSVEGLNQEIERIVLREVAYFEEDCFQRREPTPEGHRAPIADLFRRTHQSVDTQTPFDPSDGGCLSGSSNSSNSGSVSPAVPILLGHMDTSRPSSTESKGNTSSPDVDSTPRLATSPHINKFLAREPPDGCEKVKIAEESRNACEIPEYSCPKPSMNFVLLPSRRSAFYPLCKNCGMSAPNGDVVNSGTPPASEGF